VKSGSGSKESRLIEVWQLDTEGDFRASIFLEIQDKIKTEALRSIRLDGHKLMYLEYKQDDRILSTQFALRLRIYETTRTQ